MFTHTMKSTNKWSSSKTAIDTASSTESWNASAQLRQAAQMSSRILFATLSASAIIIGATWAVSAFEIPSVLQAMIWAAGFVFLALAVESKSNFPALMVTGLTLPLLAILSAQVATEFAVVAAALLSIWVAAKILKF